MWSHFQEACNHPDAVSVFQGSRWLRRLLARRNLPGRLDKWMTTHRHAHHVNTTNETSSERKRSSFKDLFFTKAAGLSYAAISAKRESRLELLLPLLKECNVSTHIIYSNVLIDTQVQMCTPHRAVGEPAAWLSSEQISSKASGQKWSKVI